MNVNESKPLRGRREQTNLLPDMSGTKERGEITDSQKGCHLWGGGEGVKRSQDYQLLAPEIV